jgi:hypothetical protein
MTSAELQLAQCVGSNNVEARERRSDRQRPWAVGIDIATAKPAGRYGGPRRRERLLYDAQHRVPHHLPCRCDRNGVLIDMRKILARNDHEERFYEHHTRGQPERRKAVPNVPRCNDDR